jgi:L-threonylcarbamoyladenylate synthase
MVIPLENPDTVRITVEVLKKSGIVIFPCDTIYGISGIVPVTEDRIREVKGRGESKPFIQLYLHAEEAARMAAHDIDKQLIRYWPGPLTLIIQNKKGGKIGVRVPDDPFTRLILEGVNVPVFSTSVNKSGQPPVNNIRRIIDEFEKEVDIIIDGGDFTENKPSTIVDTTSIPYKLLRQGAVEVVKDLPFLF